MKQILTGILVGLIGLCFGSEGFALLSASNLPSFSPIPAPSIVMTVVQHEVGQALLVAKRGGKRGGKKAKRVESGGDTKAEERQERAEREKKRAETERETAERQAEQEKERAEGEQEIAEGEAETEEEIAVHAAGTEKKRTGKQSGLRGLDRADEVAGEHGEQGRKRARDKRGR